MKNVFRITMFLCFLSWDRYTMYLYAFRSTNVKKLFLRMTQWVTTLVRSLNTRTLPHMIAKLPLKWYAKCRNVVLCKCYLVTVAHARAAHSKFSEWTLVLHVLVLCTIIEYLISILISLKIQTHVSIYSDISSASALTSLERAVRLLWLSLDIVLLEDSSTSITSSSLTWLILTR